MYWGEFLVCSKMLGPVYVSSLLVYVFLLGNWIHWYKEILRKSYVCFLLFLLLQVEVCMCGYLPLGFLKEKKKLSCIFFFFFSSLSSFFVLCFLFFVFWDKVFLYSPGCPGTHFVDRAGLELRNPPASAFWVLGLKACTTMSFLWCSFSLYVGIFHLLSFVGLDLWKDIV